MSLDYKEIFEKNFDIKIEYNIPQFLIEEDYYNSLDDFMDGEAQLNNNLSYEFISKFPFFKFLIINDCSIFICN